MKKTEFNKRVNELIIAAQKECAGVVLTGANMWVNKTPIPSVFHYAAISEHCMERQLKELKGCKRETTFMADLSRGEWLGAKGLFDTIRNAMKSWADDVTYMAEFVLCINWKAWEHNARGNSGWSQLYSVFYELVRDLMYDYYEGNDEKTSYMFRYLD